MKNKWLYYSGKISILVIILAVMYVILLCTSATSINNSLESNEDYSGAELGGYYNIIVSDIDYSTTPYCLDISLGSYEITMPLHMDKIMLEEAEKERFLLKDYEKNFYFGSNVIKQTYYSLIEIYPEDRNYPFYYYEVCLDSGIIDSGIIDRSSGVTIRQLKDLVYLDFGYGSNANSVRFFNIGDKADISQIINVPFNYDLYTNSYSNKGWIFNALF